MGGGCEVQKGQAEYRWALNCDALSLFVAIFNQIDIHFVLTDNSLAQPQRSVAIHYTPLPRLRAFILTPNGTVQAG